MNLFAMTKLATLPSAGEHQILREVSIRSQMTQGEVQFPVRALWAIGINDNKAMYCVDAGFSGYWGQR